MSNKIRSIFSNSFTEGFFLFPYRETIDIPVLLSFSSFIFSPASASPLNPCSCLLYTSKTYYYQRCGIAKNAPFAHSGFIDGACHLADTLCLNFINPGVERLKRNVSGGWHDAGDYNKYVNFAYASVIDLLMSFQLHPQAWASDQMGIPESGNGIPDLLDEIKYETDWLLKMQDKDVYKRQSISNSTNVGNTSTLVSNNLSFDITISRCV